MRRLLGALAVVALLIGGAVVTAHQPSLDAPATAGNPVNWYNQYTDTGEIKDH